MSFTIYAILTRLFSILILLLLATERNTHLDIWVQTYKQAPQQITVGYQY